MKKKTIGWLMMSPIIFAWLWIMASMIGWKVILVVIGIFALALWMHKAIEFMYSRD